MSTLTLDLVTNTVLDKVSDSELDCTSSNDMGHIWLNLK